MDGDFESRKSKRLLERYNLTLDNLSFEYIAECQDQKKLEQMLKILRSGEEGSYPDLTKCCEDRLEKLFPDSRVLIKQQDILRGGLGGKEELKEYSESIKEQDVNLSKDAALVSKTSSFVPVRQAAVVQQPEKPKLKIQQGDGDKKAPTSVVVKKSVAPRSYADWDKFDPEEEMLKMDLEEEKKMEKKEKKNKMSKNTRRKVGKYPPKTEEAKLVPKEAISPQEQQALSLAEKVKGNECYQARDYLKAIEHYSAGIALHPTVDHYNNRAASYLKLEKFSLCSRDCSEAISLDPWNVKALYRRGVANKGLKQLEDAVRDLRQVMEIEPKNVPARQLLCELELENFNAQKSGWEEQAGPSIITKPTSSRRMLIQELN